MRIEWKRSVPAAGLLPRHHPAAGILGGDGDLRAGGVFAFDLDPAPLPAPRAIEPGALAAIEARLRALDAPQPSLDGVARLADGAGAVVTGQQAGLLGGPLFTLLKTATAIRLARELERRHGRPFVPVFWAETDDHDLDEVNEAWAAGAAGPVRLSLAVPEKQRGGAVGALPLGPGAAEVVEAFFAAGPQTEFTPALQAGLLEDLAGSPDWRTWFTRQLLRLYGRLGLVVADPLDPPLAAAAKPLWARVIEEPLELTRSCQEQGRRLAASGWRPVLQKLERRTPFFLLDGGRRLPVTFERGLFRSSAGDATALALRQRLDERPADFSAAVHLRPILQDFLLPTAAYVAGPTELAYFLQVLPGYGALGVPPPAIVLRASATLVEPPAERALGRYGVEPQELRAGLDAPLAALVRREQRAASPTLWEQLRAQTLRPLAKLADGLAAEHPDLAQRAGQTRGKVEFLLKELEGRTVAELRRKSETAREQLARARARLYPEGRPQERVLSSLVFLSRYGPGLVDALIEQLPGDFTRHWYGTIVPETPA